MICVRQPCTIHEHPGHPGTGHCEGDIDERNEGYMGLDLFTLDDEKPKCCCRDERESSGLDNGWTSEVPDAAD